MFEMFHSFKTNGILMGDKSILKNKEDVLV